MSSSPRSGCAEETDSILGALEDPAFAAAVAGARLVLHQQDTSVSKSERPVPVSNLLDIYRTRRGLHSLPPALAEELDKLLGVLGRSDDHGWYLYAITGPGGQLAFALFASEDRVGRACIDLSK